MKRTGFGYLVGQLGRSQRFANGIWARQMQPGGESTKNLLPERCLDRDLPLQYSVGCLI